MKAHWQPRKFAYIWESFKEKKAKNFVSKSLIFEKNVKGTIHDDFSIIEGF